MTKFRTFLLAAAACAATAAFQTPAAASITIGVADTGNCLPFACDVYLGQNLYQEVYSAAAFSGPTTIGSATFFRDQGGDMDTATFHIEFYTTAQAVGGLDTTPANNLGALLSNFGNFHVSGAMPAELTFAGHAFTYDPSAGNLLMQITQTSGSVNFAGSFFQADDTDTVISRLFGTTDGAFTGAYGLVTRFDEQGSTAPEPAAWALLVAGFGSVGAALRRRRTLAFA